MRIYTALSRTGILLFFLTSQAIAAGVDLSVTIDDSPDPSFDGFITYSFTVTNIGDLVASDVVLRVELDPGLTFIAAHSSCTAFFVGIDVFVNCPLGVVNVGQTVDDRAILVSTSTFGVFGVSAFVSSAEADINVANNQDTENTTVVDPNADSDGDGITDAEEEYTYGTDPNDADTDGDGLTDDVELFSENQTDPLDQDTDNDGLLDGAEDFDRDGVFDVGVESNPVDADTDDDGSSDGDEVQTFNTDPLNPDSDGDGLLDGLELGVTTPIPSGVSDGNSVVQVAFVGTDFGIFVSDADPTTMTDPNNADTDGDGLTDGFEDTNQNGRLDAGETDPLTSDEPPPPPEITCLEAAKAVINAAHDYQRTSRKVAKDCGRQANDDCAATLQAQVDAFVILESEQIVEEQACQP